MLERIRTVRAGILMLAAAVFVMSAGAVFVQAADSSLQSADSDMSADDIFREMEKTLFPDSYYMKAEMVTEETGGREREMTMEITYARDAGSYMELLSPPRSRGTRFLEKDDSLWMYIPRSNSRSAIRLSPRDSFQGSAFSNDDLSDSNYTEDYQSSVLREETFAHEQLGDIACFVLEAVPARPEAAYGRILIWITNEGYIPLKMEYYVRSGLKTKIMKLYDIQETAGRRRPLRMEMEALDEGGKRSVVTILEMEERTDISDRIFTRNYLTR